MKVVTIGNAIIDFYVDLNKRFPGGSALNVAVYSRRFGAEKSSFIGIIGSDLEGNHILKTLTEERVNYIRLKQRLGETGKVFITLNENNDREIGKWNKGVIEKETLELSEQDFEYIFEHDILHIGVNSNMQEMLPELSKKIKISFDFSTKKHKNLLGKIAPYLHVAFLSCSEMTLEEIKMLGKYIHSLGTKHVFLTRGEKGATYFGNEGFQVSEVSNKKEIIDTLGAGDTFVAYCLSNLYVGFSPQQLLKDASKKATETCFILGGFGHSL